LVENVKCVRARNPFVFPLASPQHEEQPILGIIVRDHGRAAGWNSHAKTAPSLLVLLFDCAKTSVGKYASKLLTEA
jgi:hypothetical protein